MCLYIIYYYCGKNNLNFIFCQFTLSGGIFCAKGIKATENNF